MRKPPISYSQPNTFYRFYCLNVVVSLSRLKPEEAGEKPYFAKAMTAYRKLPLAYPRRMARKACRKAMPSRPWLRAKAQRAGFWTRDQVMSLFFHVSIMSF